MASNKIAFLIRFRKKNSKVHVWETSFQFGKDDVQDFLRKYGIEKDHFICFDEVICQKYSKAFVIGLSEMKDNVSGLWLAIGGKSANRHFSKRAIENAINGPSSIDVPE